LLCAASCLPTPADAQCIDYRNYFHWESVVRTPAYATGYDLSDDFAFVMDIDSGLVVVDFSDVAFPRIVSMTPIHDGAHAIVRDGIAYILIASSQNIEIMDVTDPFAPTSVGRIDVGGEVNAFAVDRHLGFAAVQSSPNNEIVAFDLSVPSTARRLGSVALDYFPWSIYAHAGYAYVVAYGEGVRIVDVRDPVNMVEVAAVNTDKFTFDVAVQGHFAYLADLAYTHPGGVQAVDVSVPSAPVLRGRLTGLEAVQIAVYGELAVAAINNWSQIGVIDLRDPASPSLLRVVPGFALYPKIHQGYIFGTGGGDGLGITRLEISPPAPLLGTHSLREPAWDLIVHGSHAYVANGGTGLLVVDVDPYDTMNTVGALSLAGSIRGVASIDDTTLLISNWNVGLNTVDISNGSQPRVLGWLTLPPFLYQAVVHDGFAYVAAGTAGLHVVDVRNPTALLRVGGFDAGGDTRGLEVADGYAYLAVGQGLEILDVSDPASPQPVATVDTPGTALDVAVADGRAYVADGDHGLQIIDVSDPRVPALISTASLAGDAQSVKVSGPLAFVATGAALHVVDIQDPTRPVVVGANYDGWGGQSMALDGHVLLVGTSTGLVALPTQCLPPDVIVNDAPRETDGLQLSPARPNPTMSHATLEFTTPQAGDVSVAVFDVSGRLVRTLAAGWMAAGKYETTWDGRDASTLQASAGVYFARIRVGSESRSERVVLVR
jgi:hypothetical protein